MTNMKCEINKMTVFGIGDRDSGRSKTETARESIVNYFNSNGLDPILWVNLNKNESSGVFGVSGLHLDMVHLGEVGPVIWDDIMNELETKLQDTEFKRHDATPDWRKLAHRRKFEREAFSKYGYFKDFILHPKVQLIKHYTEQNARLDNIVVGESFTSITNIIILVFMLSRRLDNSIVILLAAFLLNLNPVYVTMVTIVTLFLKKRRLPKGYIARKRVAGQSAKPKSLKEVNNEFISQLSTGVYDHILIGNDIATYYTASLLSRSGHKCIIIEPSDSPSYEVHPSNAPCPAPILSGNVSKVERYQPLIDCVQSRDASKRIVFTPVGTATDGYTNAVIRVIAPSQSFKNSLGQIIHRNAYSSTLYSRPGEHALVHFLCSTLSVEKSRLLGAFEKIRVVWNFLTSFLYSKCIIESEWKNSSLATNPLTKQFQEMISLPLDQYLFNCDIGEGKVQDALHALACALGAQEVLPRNELSSFAFGVASQIAESGSFVPVGGIPTLMAMFKNEIFDVGGLIITNVDSIKLEVNPFGESYKATGVAVSSDDKEEVSIVCQQSVISGLGILSTYAGLLSSDILSEATKKKLVSLEEAKPKVKIVFWLQGNKERLGMVSTDFYQVVIKQPIKDDVSTGKKTQLGDFCHIWSPSASDPKWENPNIQVLVVEMDVNLNFVSKTPMDLLETFKGPSFFVDPRNEETNPNDPMFAERLCRRLKISKSKENDFIRVAESLIRQLFPNILNRDIICTHVEPPVLGGSKLANNAAKYSSSISAISEVKNLYLTGADLTGIGLSGDLQSGWVTANAVLGYTMSELVDGRSVVQDIR